MGWSQISLGVWVRADWSSPAVLSWINIIHLFHPLVIYTPDLNAFFFWRTFRWQYKICICGGVSGWVQTHPVSLGWIFYLSDTTAGLLAGKAFIGQMRQSGALSKMRLRQLCTESVSFGMEVFLWNVPWRWKVLRREKSTLVLVGAGLSVMI